MVLVLNLGWCYINSNGSIYTTAEDTPDDGLVKARNM